ncbi:GNAT family N-acetyltransferase [Dactylosporangium sp. AC04546]|uniref:GNAT family N-acetyltransferase n=1 Tax=Dactylosporangium sp. AC04546 TaxID=2862460 RepID=UPI001EE042A5|nr:GNAT family N-acetyltransferase [Dactylosporangium sp. AC04546]WVK84755.1 GNAT family N-acetyltransferase [Dactylosporangium sp. AC04546]
MKIRGCTLRDVPAILTVTRASDIASLGEPDWSEAEVVETLTAPNHDPAVDSWLAFDADGEPLAWAYVDNPQRGVRDNVEVYAVPERGAVGYVPLLDLAIARVAERARENGYPEVVLRAGALAAESAYLAVLAEKGFKFVKRHARMNRALTGEERAPEGHPIRPVKSEELGRFHEVLEAAFADTPDYQPTPYDTWREAIDRLPSVSFDEWFVYTDGDEIVGVLQSADQAVEHNEGWVKNLAVLRSHRKRGVGGALLRTAFAAYAAKGRASAGLGVDLTNPTGAYQLYEGVGMTVTFAADMWERAVTASPSSSAAT